MKKNVFLLFAMLFLFLSACGSGEAEQLGAENETLQKMDVIRTDNSSQRIGGDPGWVTTEITNRKISPFLTR